MIGRIFAPQDVEEEIVAPKGFDDFELQLGDMMRGERATLGKSLLDVQRELKIKAGYISAIEDSNPSAFDSPGFIAGYVRSYARYLQMDPEWAFQKFCEESGFATAHGMSSEASSPRPVAPLAASAHRNVFNDSATPFVPKADPFFARIDAGAIGTVAVMIALIGGMGFGGMSILRQVQQVEFTPVEQTPVVASSIDPLAPAPQLNTGASRSGTQTAALAPTRNNDALDRLYRPEALDVPVFTPRDAPIATIDPGTVGTFATGGVDFAALNVPAEAPQVQVVDGPAPEVVLFAVNPTWVRVRSADGSILFEKVLEKGENYALPVTEETPVLRAGNSGSLYFKVNGQIVGPAGQGATTVNNVQLASADLSAAYSVADPLEDSELFALLEKLDAPDVLPRPRTRPIESIAAAKGSVSLVASQPSWVRITDAKGTRVFEKTLQPGEQYTLPADVDAPLLRAGNSGALYLKLGDALVGPVGSGSATARNVSLTASDISAKYSVVDTDASPSLKALLDQ